METTALVEGCRSDESVGDDGDYAAAGGVRAWWRILWAETVKLWSIGGPIAFQVVCQYGVSSVSIGFLGHLTDLDLSSFSIALTVVGSFGFGFMFGMGSALETLCGQAFGAGKVHILGIYMQRSFIILFLTSVLLSPIYIFATRILKLLGQPQELAISAGFYAILILPQLFSYVVSMPTQKFLHSQSKVTVIAWIAALSLLLHVLLCSLFINVFGRGAVGVAIAIDLTSWMSAAGQFFYIIHWCKDSWKGFSSAAFNDIWGFLRLSLESTVMTCLDVWYTTILTVLAGNLEHAVTAVGALSICQNINGFEGMVFIGVNIAISVRVSNELGLGHPRTAKYAVYVTLFLSLLIGILFMIVVLITRNDIAILYTNSENMKREVAHLSGLLGFTMLLNSIQLVISGVAVGGGWQGLVAYINLGCYYVFGLPLAYILGYTANFGVKGLWSGMIIGVVLQTISFIVVFYKTNWNKEVEQTTERMRKWGDRDIAISKS